MRFPSIVIACLMALPPLSKAAEQVNPTNIVRAARSQVGKTLGYDSTYRTLGYPNGDLPMEMGVCTDVIVRALRSSLRIDLQRCVHEDMKRHFSRYPL